ncbi:MAG: HAD family hydrolase, partial [Acutalibacteraceae bacterium]
MIKEKKSLSDWLIASDIDGTLNNKLRRLPKRNFDAIQKFVYEYGGNFILASGRSYESMRKHFEKLKLNSGYCVFINGAGVYDYKNEKVMWVCPVEENIEQLIRQAASKFKSAKLQIDTANEVYLVKPNIPALILAASSKLKKKFFSSAEELPKGEWCKAIFIGTPWTVKKVEKFFTDALGDGAENL